MLMRWNLGTTPDPVGSIYISTVYVPCDFSKMRALSDPKKFRCGIRHVHPHERGYTRCAEGSREVEVREQRIPAIPADSLQVAKTQEPNLLKDL